MKRDCQVLEGSLSDIPRVMALCELFFKESNFSHLTYDAKLLTQRILVEMGSDNMFLAVGAVDGRIVGFHLFTLERHYTVERIAFSHLLYVLPEYRPSPLGRDLVKRACEIAQANGAVAFYCTSTAGISKETDQRIINMLGKLGFETLGQFARKELSNG